MICFKLNTKNGIVKAFIDKRCVATIIRLSKRIHVIQYMAPALVTNAGITVGYNYNPPVTEQHTSLEEAKRAIIAHFVAKRLEQS